MSSVKVTCTVKKGYLMHLPGNYRIWGGQTTEIPVELLENEGVKRYLKSGKLAIVQQAGLQVPAVDKVPAPVVPEKVEVVDIVEEGPDAVFMGAIESDGSFTPAEQVELTTEAPVEKKNKKKRKSEETSSDEGASSEEGASE